MPSSERAEKPSKLATAGYLILALWILFSASEWIYGTIFDGFNFSWGFYTFLVAQSYSYVILMKAYRSWMGSGADMVVQNGRAECAGHLLNYTLHSLAFFVLGGYSKQQVESDYMSLGFDETTGWLGTLGAANCRVGYWASLLFPTYIIALWGSAGGDTPWLSRKCITLMDRLMTRFGDGPTKAQLKA